jgi:peptide/nickel transport system substrate-binding protein
MNRSPAPSSPTRSPFATTRRRFWGKDAFGTPAMTAINHPIFKSNNDSDLKLESGELDAAQTFTSQICKSVGIDVVTEFPQAPQVTTAIQDGDFELACWNASGVSIVSPWTRFRDVLDDRGVAPIGKIAFANFTRFSHPDVAGLLDVVGSAGSDDELKTIYAELDSIYREGIPVIPSMYRSNGFYEYNASNWTNFPDEKNPYAPPGWTGASIGWIFGLKRVGG